MSQRFDVLVIGSGAAGGACARILKAEGLDVAIAEGGPFGGTCALRGCEPKKVLAETAHAVARVREMAQANGVRGDLSIHWPTLAARKQFYVDRVPPWSEDNYQSLGITLLRGRARFTGSNTMLVGDTPVEAARIVLATGSKPQPLSFPGAKLLAVSDDFLNLKELPPRIAFIGGGYISMEFAHIAAIAGATVTMAVRGDRCLKRFEPDLVSQLCAATASLGVEVLYHSPPHSLEKTESGFVLRVGALGEHAVEADMVFHGAGRVPDLDGLDPAAAGIAVEDGKLTLDSFLKTTNPAVYAAGDAAWRYQLTPTAVMEGRAVAANILHGDHVSPDYAYVPSATFTHPTLAGVGLTEEQAKSAGLAYEVKAKTGLSWSELTRLGIRHSGYKVILEPGGGKLLGLFYMGEDAEEVVNLAALCMRQGLTVSQIMDMVWAYPSFGYTLRYMLA
ncbi:dihydrolipoyl dehydrogenase family protein [Fundidesulfovibrio terrae]|uniref:dihydrolipoyl dehydrogenase family protein n=1 Tax=Fundidesulfovibrio terrae TaxID=2922866 RepID=UPI001FAEE363|nr:NAD(P)/FAD-dependent oxidoreductase [Fundidesulfovibrio terrae]